MKIFTTILLLSTSIYSCDNSQSEKVSSVVGDVAQETTDTRVCSITTPDGTEKEYFLIIYPDTSNFSLFVDSNSRASTVAKYGYGSDKNLSSEFSADSGAVAMDFREIREYPTNYSQQLMELTLLLSRAAMEFNLQKLQVLRVSMRDILGLSVSITKQYTAKYGERFGSESNSSVADLIMKSNYVTDLNAILTTHKVQIDNVFIDGLAYYALSNSPSSALDGIVIFTIRPLD